MDTPKRMWPPYEAFYTEAMLFNTKSAISSAEVVATVLNALTKGQITDLKDLDHHAILDAVQNVISHAAMLSKYFWPIRRKLEHVERAEFLRKKYRIQNDNPLHSRSLRDYLEHFDEKLDIYLKDGIVGHIIPSYVGYAPHNEFEIPTHIFRAFYIDTGVFQTLTNSYAMYPIFSEIYRLHQRLLEQPDR